MRRPALLVVVVGVVVTSSVIGCVGPPTCNSDAQCAQSELCVAGACAVIVDAPVLEALPATLSLPEDTIGFVGLGVVDVGDTGEPIDFVLLAPATLGSAVVSGATLTYAPAADTSGAETLTFAPLSGGKLGRPAHVDVEIRAVDDGPVLSVQGPFADTDAGHFHFDASATDREDQAITFSAQFDNGTTVVPPAGDDGITQIDYVADADFHGADSGTITATDEGGAFASLTVGVDVP